MAPLGPKAFSAASLLRTAIKAAPLGGKTGALASDFSQTSGLAEFGQRWTLECSLDRIGSDPIGWRQRRCSASVIATITQ